MTGKTVAQHARSGAPRPSASAGKCPAALDETFEKEFINKALNALRTKVAALGPDQMPPVEELIEYGMRAIRPAHPVARLVGPVYDTAGVGKLTGWQRQQIDDRRRRGTILAAKTSNGTWVYPVGQFAGGAIHPAVRTVLDALRWAKPDGWTLLSWFAAPENDLLGGRSPMEWLTAGYPVEPVERLAIADAHRWAA